MKKIPLKKVVSYSIIPALALLTAACGSNTNTASTEKSASTKSGPVNLEVYSWTDEQAMQPFIEGFEKANSKIKVKYTKMADSTTTTANTLLTSGAPIDVIPTYSTDDSRTRAANGMYQSLDEYMKADKIDFAKTFGKAVDKLETVNGKHYAIPYGISTYGLYYNKALFDKAGVPYPNDNWTWDDLRAAAKKLTSGSGANTTYGILLPYTDQWDFPAIEQLGDNYQYKNNGKESNWDNPAFLKSLQFAYDMQTKDKSALPMSDFKALKADTNPQAIFLQGKVAMYIGASFVPKWSSLPAYGFGNFDFGVANLPKLNASDNLKNIFYISDYSMPVNAPNKKAAWEYLKFYTMEAPELFAQSKGMTSANISSMDPEKQKKIGDIIFNYPHFDKETGIKTFVTNKPDLISLKSTYTANKAQIDTVVKNEVTNTLMGNQTPAQAIANMKKQTDDLLKQAAK